MTDTALTPAEFKRLLELEAVIDRGMTTFVDVGLAMLSIRDEKLYRKGYATFERYVNARWNITRGRAYQLITAGLLHTQVDIQNERQARELKRLETPTERRIAWELAKEAGASIAPGKDVPTVAVKAAVDAISEAKVTDGNTDPGTGEMEAISARVTQEVYESVQRQRQHVRERLEKQNGNENDAKYTGSFTVVHVDGGRGFVTLCAPDLAAAVGAGERGTFIVYVKQGVEA
jgi:hypothetical protein